MKKINNCYVTKFDYIKIQSLTKEIYRRNGD